MHITNLRKVGGSVMLAVPPALLDVLKLKAGAAVGVAVDGNRLVVQASSKPKYKLADLLAATDVDAETNAADREWLDAPPVGKELF